MQAYERLAGHVSSQGNESSACADDRTQLRIPYTPLAVT